MSAMGRHALALCGIAARTLGWRPADFWEATPAELAASLGLAASDAAPAAPQFDRAALAALFAEPLMNFCDE